MQSRQASAFHGCRAFAKPECIYAISPGSPARVEARERNRDADVRCALSLQHELVACDVQTASRVVPALQRAFHAQGLSRRQMRIEPRAVDRELESSRLLA
jgi:hypothetical protein